MHFTVLYKSLTHSGWPRSSSRSLLVVGHAGLAVGPVLEARLHDGAHGEEGGRRGDAGIGINAFLSVFINSVRRNKRFSLGIFLHISVVYGPYVEPNKRVVQ